MAPDATALCVVIILSKKFAQHHNDIQFGMVWIDPLWHWISSEHITID